MVSSYHIGYILERQRQGVHLFGGDGYGLRQRGVVTSLDVALDVMALGPQHQQTVLIVNVPHLTQAAAAATISLQAFA